MLELLLVMGWVFLPVIVPLAYFVVRRNYIKRPILFLLQTFCIAFFLYFILAFPLGIFFLWLTPQYGGGIFSIPHLWAAQALLTLPMLGIMVRAEREQNVG